MRRWIALAAGLYPRGWREEYGEEFRALLDDVKPGWRVFANVLRGALTMQIAKGTEWKVAAAITAAGAIVAAAISFTVPPRYVSSAVIQFAPRPDPLRPASPLAIQERAADRLAQMETDILSRGSLAEIIQLPALDLYKKERYRIPMEDIVLQMRRDIRIEPLPRADGGMAPFVFRVSFANPDQFKAQAVVRHLATKFSEQNATLNHWQGALYQAFWQDQAKAHHAKPAPPPPVGARLEILDPASLPASPVRPNRLVFLAWGLAGGLLVGLQAALSLRHPRGMWLLGGYAAAGCILAAAASFLIPDRYTSTAVMRISPPMITEDPLATPTATPVAERLQQLQPEVVSRTNLAEIIQKPSLNLYARERAKEPIEEVIRNMRDRDLRIAMVDPPQGAPGAASAFSISFAYSDKYKAQAVVREFVTAFTELNRTHARANAPQMSVTLREIYEHKAGENLLVLDPASLPESPVSPNRLAIAAAGLGIGLLLGVLTLWRRRPHAPA